jgi:hypothetical protein
MNNIQFSLIAPSIRPHLWKQFYNSIQHTEINYEVIFIGPLPPIENLPVNVRWIESTVKPSQCTHIGFLEAKGEIISLTADDAQYFSPNNISAIDNMYSFIMNFPKKDNYNPQKIAYGFRMFEDKFCIETTNTHYLTINKNSSVSQPLLYPFFAIYKDLYMEIGGYDNRFICGQAENDFLLRITEKYGNTISSVCPTAMVWADHEDHKNSGKFREYHKIENTTLRDLWLLYSHEVPDGKYVSRRLDTTIKSYINDDTLYSKSQGECGEWK